MTDAVITQQLNDIQWKLGRIERAMEKLLQQQSAQQVDVAAVIRDTTDAFWNSPVSSAVSEGDIKDRIRPFVQISDWYSQ